MKAIIDGKEVEVSERFARLWLGLMKSQKQECKENVVVLCCCDPWLQEMFKAAPCGIIGRRGYSKTYGYSGEVQGTTHFIHPDFELPEPSRTSLTALADMRQTLCAIDTELKKHYIFFYGIDVIIADAIKRIDGELNA